MNQLQGGDNVTTNSSDFDSERCLEFPQATANAVFGVKVGLDSVGIMASLIVIIIMHTEKLQAIHVSFGDLPYGSQHSTSYVSNLGTYSSASDWRWSDICQRGYWLVFSMPGTGILGFSNLLDWEFGHHLDHASNGVVTLSPTERSIPRFTGRSATDMNFKKVGDIWDNLAHSW